MQIKIAKAMRASDGARYTQERIAELFGVDRTTVSLWLNPKGHSIQADNVTPVSDADCRVKVPPQKRPEVAEMARERGIKKTADQLGISESTVKRIKTVEEKAATKDEERKATVAKLGNDILGIHHGDFREYGQRDGTHGVSDERIQFGKVPYRARSGQHGGRVVFGVRLRQVLDGLLGFERSGVNLDPLRTPGRAHRVVRGTVATQAPSTINVAEFAWYWHTPRIPSFSYF